MKKLVSLLLALVMLFTLVACNTTEPEQTKPVDTKPQAGNNDDTKPTETTTPPEPVKITLFPLNANVMSGEVGGWIGEYLAEHGIILEIMAHSDDKLQAILAGQDLPDIMYLPAGTDFLSLAESGLFMDMEQHLDKLPNLTSNETYQTAINYVKEFVTDGTLTMLPQNVGPAAVNTTTGSAVKLNWEVYEQIGCPEFDNLEELVPILKQMKEAYPKDANGSETYAMYMFNNMDTTYFYNVMSTFVVMGYTNDNIQYGIETNQVDGSWNWMFEDDSAYKESLKFFNTLYKEDLLDPDSVSTDRSTQHNKQVAGGALCTWQGVPGYEANGYYPAYFKDYILSINAQGYPYGGGTYAAVSAKTENLETVLKFLNLSADPDAVRILSNGPQGELWDRDADGNLVITDKGIATYLNGEEVYIGEEKYVFFNTPWLIHPNTVHPIDGDCVAAHNSKVYKQIAADTDGQKKWAENYGYTDICTMLQDKGQEIARFDENVAKFAAKSDDNQNLIIAAAKEIIVNGSWKMVYAKNDAEFEQIWDDMVKEVEELGFKDIFNWRVAALEEGMKIRDSLAG